MGLCDIPWFLQIEQLRMENDSVYILLQKYAHGELDEAEKTALQQFLFAEGDEAAQKIHQLIEHHSGEATDLPDHWQESVRQILAADKFVSPAIIMQASARRHKIQWFRMAAAVAVFLIFIAFFWMYYQTKPGSVTANRTEAVLPGLPGKEGAVLTLSDGSQVVLDSVSGSWTTRQQGTDIKLSDGVLNYKPGNVAETVVYNTMTTPRGRKFHMILPDGSRVWLNAGSSIRFPVSFHDSKRIVELHGEAYFEIAENPGQPFMVDIGRDRWVQVLGTHFNVNAYDNEPLVKTTLLQGAVAIQTPREQKQMIPGQQITIASSGVLALNKNADTEQAVAWKNNSFSFKNESLPGILRQLSRWYDIDIKIENEAVVSRSFTSNLSMNNELSVILRILEQTGLTFSMEGKTLTVK